MRNQVKRIYFLSDKRGCIIKSSKGRLLAIDTVPCHYGMFASRGGNPGLFYKIMTEEYPDNAFLLMAQGEKITI